MDNSQPTEIEKNTIILREWDEKKSFPYVALANRLV